MILDIEITLNRFGLHKPAPNKLQLGPIRLALWRKMKKHAISLEINWLTKQAQPESGSQ